MSRRSCYLCSSKHGDNVIQHKFPQDAFTRKLWMQACNLSEETDDVSNVHVCSAHFVPKDYTPGTKRLQHGTVPSVNIPGTVAVEELKTEAVVQYEFVSLASVGPDVEETEIPVDLWDGQEVTIKTEMEGNHEDLAEDGLRGDDEDEGSSDETDNLSPAPKKPRRWFHPRFVSEITPEDLQTPRDVRRVITFVKEQSQKQTIKIQSLQQQNRRLRNQVHSLRMLVEDLRKQLNG